MSVRSTDSSGKSSGKRVQAASCFICGSTFSNLALRFRHECSSCEKDVCGKCSVKYALHDGFERICNKCGSEEGQDINEASVDNDQLPHLPSDVSCERNGCHIQADSEIPRFKSSLNFNNLAKLQDAFPPRVAEMQGRQGSKESNFSREGSELSRQSSASSLSASEFGQQTKDEKALEALRSDDEDFLLKLLGKGLKHDSELAVAYQEFCHYNGITSAEPIDKYRVFIATFTDQNLVNLLNEDWAQQLVKKKLKKEKKKEKKEMKWNAKLQKALEVGLEEKVLPTKAKLEPVAKIRAQPPSHKVVRFEDGVEACDDQFRLQLGLETVLESSMETVFENTQAEPQDEDCQSLQELDFRVENISTTKPRPEPERTPEPLALTKTECYLAASVESSNADPELHLASQQQAWGSLEHLQAKMEARRRLANQQSAESCPEPCLSEANSKLVDLDSIGPKPKLALDQMCIDADTFSTTKAEPESMEVENIATTRPRPEFVEGDSISAKQECHTAQVCTEAKNIGNKRPQLEPVETVSSTKTEVYSVEAVATISAESQLHPAQVRIEAAKKEERSENTDEELWVGQRVRIQSAVHNFSTRTNAGRRGEIIRKLGDELQWKVRFFDDRWPNSDWFNSMDLEIEDSEAVASFLSAGCPSITAKAVANCQENPKESVRATYSHSAQHRDLSSVPTAKPVPQSELQQSPFLTKAMTRSGSCVAVQRPVTRSSWHGAGHELASHLTRRLRAVEGVNLFANRP